MPIRWQCTLAWVGLSVVEGRGGDRDAEFLLWLGRDATAKTFAD